MSVGDRTSMAATPLQSEEHSRRLACDRCRGQKLRCERNSATGPDNGPCNRCAKARARCTTSSPRRLGRPRQQSHAPSSVSSEHKTVPLNGAVPTVQTSDRFQDGFGSQGIPSAEDLDFQTLLTADNSWGGGCDWPFSGGGRASTSQDRHFGRESQCQCQLGDVMMGAHTPMSPTAGLGLGNSTDTTSSDPSAFSSPQEEHMSKILSLTGDVYLLVTQIEAHGIGWCSSTFNLGAHEPNPQTCVSGQSTPARNVWAAGQDQPYIGRMLERSQEFLQTVKYFIGSYPDESSLSSDASPTSPCSDYDYEIKGTDPSNASQTHSTTPTSGARKSQTHCFNTASSTGYSSSVSDFAARPGTSPLSANLPKADFPIVFAILTCYVALLRLYRLVFAHIHSLLPNISSPLTERPPLLPGLHVAGFRLDSHHNLQIDILQQISGNMLTQMEKAVQVLDSRHMGSSGMGREGTGGRTRDQTLQKFSLLQIILRQEAASDTSGNKDRPLLPLKATMRGIKRTLKGEMPL